MLSSSSSTERPVSGRTTGSSRARRRGCAEAGWLEGTTKREGMQKSASKPESR